MNPIPRLRTDDRSGVRWEWSFLDEQGEEQTGKGHGHYVEEPWRHRRRERLAYHVLHLFRKSCQDLGGEGTDASSLDTADGLACHLAGQPADEERPEDGDADGGADLTDVVLRGSRGSQHLTRH